MNISIMRNVPSDVCTDRTLDTLEAQGLILFLVGSEQRGWLAIVELVICCRSLQMEGYLVQGSDCGSQAKM